MFWQCICFCVFQIKYHEDFEKSRMGGEGPPQHPQTPQKKTPPGTQPVSFVACSSGWSLTSQFHMGHKIITFFSGSISALGSISELSLWAWARASGRCRPSSQLWGNKLSHTHCPTHSFFSSPYNRLCVCVAEALPSGVWLHRSWWGRGVVPGRRHDHGCAADRWGMDVRKSGAHRPAGDAAG